MHYQKSDPIALGSGELYFGYSKDIADLSNLTTEEENALINAGAIEAGANLDIEDEDIKITSSNRGTIGKITVDKEIRFSTGIMTWVLKNISKYLMGANFTEDKEGEVLKSSKAVIGKNDQKPELYIRFVHQKGDGGTITVNMYKAQFEGKTNFNFEKEKPTTIDYAFIANTDDEQNYIEIVETFEEAI
ncbi:hypothetical protein WAK64_20710 [Bacillus spongiae]|uniref:Phage tail protein n=1 Tax=Bacillus spongiae TaxID=2683610 RepID=A0ABU8HK26_9BACI